MARVLNRLRRQRDESGVGVVTALMCALIVFAIGALWVQLGIHQAQSSAVDRAREQARHAADAGFNAAMDRLSAQVSYTGAPGTYVSLTNGSGGTVAQYEVVNVRCSTTGYTPPCSSDPDPNVRYIEARGWAPSRTRPEAQRRIEGQVRLVPLDGFRYAIMAAPGGFSAGNHMNITGDVYSDTAISLQNNTTVNGNVTSQSTVSTSNSSTIAGDIRAVGNITLNNSSTTVGGSVYSNGSITMSGTVKGNAQATGTITGGTVQGTRTPNSPPEPPPAQSLPTFTYDPANYPGVQVFATPAAFNTYWSANKGSFSGSFRVLGPGTVSINAKTTIVGNTTIIADGPIDVSRDVSNGSGGSTSLTLMSFATSGVGLSMSNQVTIPNDVKVLMYAPNSDVSFTQLKHFSGAVYAKSVTASNQFTLIHQPISAPGFTWDLASSSHFTVQSVNFREVPFS